MVTVATWNLENLYRPGHEFGPPNDEIYQRKLDTIADTVTEIDADILAVQEVGDPEALADLTALLPDHWHRCLSAYPDARGIRVGFASRLPFPDTTDITAFPEPLGSIRISDGSDPHSFASRMGRGALKVRIETEIGMLDLLTTHLKSKLLTYPGNRFGPYDEDERARFGAYALYRRAAEAATVRAAATALLEDPTGHRPTRDDPAVIVLGDLNDTAGAATTQVLHGPPGSQIGTGGYPRPDRGDRTRLWNVAPLIPEERRFSRIFEGQHELIDHILISHRLLDHLDAASTATASLPGITTDPTLRRAAACSDHAPVVARLL